LQNSLKNDFVTRVTNRPRSIYIN